MAARRLVSFGLTLWLLAAGAGTAAAGEVWVVELDGAITPATARYFTRSLDDAQEAGAAALIVQLDTPGGLDEAMRDMIKAILASRVPVVVYVAPNGSRAASAGTYLLYASHVAAMAPATNVGSSTPVSIGGSPFPQGEPPAEGDKGAPADAAKDAPAPAAGDDPMEAVRRAIQQDNRKK